MKTAFKAVVTTIILLALAGWMFLRFGVAGFSAREKPTALETYVARTSRNIAVSSAAKSTQNPVPYSAEVLEEARAHWADHCATCHANNGSGNTEMGRNLYPPVPDMRAQATQDLTDGELFSIIENGIRLTGMPAWGGVGHNPEDSWKLVYFIRHLSKVTADEELEMKQMNPRTPAEMEEEREEEEFLKGSDTHAQPSNPHAHHH